MIGTNYRRIKTRNIFRNYNTNNNNELIGNNNNSTLSRSIKIFSHKSNSIENKNLYNFNNNKNVLKNDKGQLCFKEFKEKKNLFFSNENSKRDIRIKEKIIKRNNLAKMLINNNKNRNDDKDNNIKNHSISNGYKNFNFSIPQQLPKNNSSSNILLNNISFIPKKIYNITKIKQNKDKINNEIDNATFRINLLKNKLSNTYQRSMCESSIYNYRRKNEENLKLLKKKFLSEKNKYQNFVYYYKLKLSKMQDNYIKINKLKEDTEKEELLFKEKKCLLIEKIFDLKIFINQIKNNNIINNLEKSISFSENDINDLSTDEMLITKNKNVHKIGQICLNKFK